ncbi:hypothetical protein VNO77_19586 [Canavalia gladiata]|uniref:Uncharacterized protein n=1 Tax=Canavalia gladiata TaxID=3824 RepID=A0AAN9LMW9_CANGL
MADVVPPCLWRERGHPELGRSFLEPSKHRPRVHTRGRIIRRMRRRQWRRRSHIDELRFVFDHSTPWPRCRGVPLLLGDAETDLRGSFTGIETFGRELGWWWLRSDVAERRCNAADQKLLPTGSSLRSFNSGHIIDSI